MAGLKPFLSRKALALTLAAGGALSMFGGLQARAQSQTALDDDAANAKSAQYGDAYMQEWKRQEALAAQSQKEHQTKSVVVDTPENRRFANQIYATAFAGIDKILKAQGKDAATKFSQNPENNPSLMALIKQAHEGQYFLVAFTLGDYMTNVKNYINGNSSLPTAISPSTWRTIVSNSQEDINKNPNFSSELSLLVACNKAGYFGPNTTTAVGLIARIKNPPVQTASLVK